MINLLPHDTKKERSYGRKNRRLIGYSISILIIGFITTSVSLSNMRYVNGDENRLKNEMSQRDTEVKALESSQQQVEKISTQLKTIDKLYSGEVKFSLLVPQIGALLPNGVVLNALTLTGGKASPLQLDIDMEDPNLAGIFAQNLIKSDLFDAVDIGAIISKGSGTAKPGQKHYGYGATLVASFKGSTAAKAVVVPK